MKYNIIQMTATASLTVPHSINPIFQYIFDCLGKKVNKVNKKNCRIWGPENPNVIIEKPMHQQRVAGADFGTVTSLGHFSSKMSKEPPLRSMMSITVPCSTNFFSQKLKRMKWIFGVNGTGPLATCRNSNVNWPSQSCDLTPLDYFCGEPLRISVALIIQRRLRP